MHIMKKILLIGTIIVLSMIIFVYTEYNKPPRLAQNEKAVAQISAKTLFSQFDTNESEAEKKYLDKVIIVSGKLAKIENTEQKYMLILDAHVDIFGVSCTLEEIYQDKDLPVKIGEQIKIKGICKGYLDDVVLTGCIIVN